MRVKAGIRNLTTEDINFVLENTIREGWNYARKDILRCFNLNPEGCFVAKIDHEKAGHVFSFNYGKSGWIGLLIVRPKHRGKGIGESLMKKAMEHLLSQGVKTIRLEAVEKAVSLYTRLGFRKEFDSLRFLKEVSIDKANLTPRESEARKIKISELPRLAEFDAEYFGANRLKVLEALHKDHPRYSFLYEEEKEIMGFIMAREIGDKVTIGPWTCNPKRADVAEQLFRSCLREIKKKFSCVKLAVGVPSVNFAAVKFMKQLGFQLIAKSIRMVYGEEGGSGNIKGVYGIGGPEKG